jgi:uncharacterized membrane protein YccC
MIGFDYTAFINGFLGGAVAVCLAFVISHLWEIRQLRKEQESNEE